MARWLTWVSDHQRQGWACSKCAWIFEIPTMLHDTEARSAYDRLASSKFQDHDCRNSHTAPASDYVENFSDRARRLVTRGFKPKDAADITLQEIMLEHRNDPAISERARTDAEDFLRRVKQGLI